ncbi:MAG: SDR family oxidoreductase [Sphingomonadales bacterium]|jgi:NAD(P)-dependent dehydrogenase (short-subunit alcohol dehydrogenase family)
MNRNIAFVTGGAQRIGKGIVLDLANKGWDIAIHFNSSKNEADILAKDIKSIGRKAIILQADLSRKIEGKDLFKIISDELGNPPSLLINNASLFEEDDIMSINEKTFWNHNAINLWAPIVLSQQFAKISKKGNIINIIDQRVANPKVGFLSYTLAKSSLLTFSKILAQELAPEIRVNAICPGPVLQSAHQTEKEFKLEVEGLPLKIAPSIQDISRAISFIIETSSLTGECITLDGGQHLS